MRLAVNSIRAKTWNNNVWVIMPRWPTICIFAAELLSVPSQFFKFIINAKPQLGIFEPYKVATSALPISLV